ncbi:glycerophosphodiester phosphodiesterase family protein [Neobacillus mesonae]|uniref:glycerophosphodiester phosphodiesterase family protein n=1 Tax=Neobacillus mesonae TaxID=1193713 RepID=UPI0020406AF9|nr:glycerophosphodiester phosphodiesterase family protein [Neobacillus mesonae]MCM3568536.1 glycerophosphodiester phosphodiesterase [Neobacillus mesonae]
MLGDVKIIAHRGASGLAPEHTMAAYQLAKEQGADYLELDIHMTKDGKLVAIHDADVNRTTNGRGKVNTFTLSQLKMLDAGSWFNQKYPEKAMPHYRGQTIPALEEILKEFGSSVNYYIELKRTQPYYKAADQLLKILRKHHLIGQKIPRGKVIVESFHAGILKYLNQQSPGLMLIQLSDNPANINFKEVSAYADGVGPNFSKISRAFVNAAHQHRLQVHCWTVNHETDMIKLMNWKIDGFFTDYVNRARKLMDGS